jgi:aspartyl-tRNA(Asn)/glutamyl-tRNA(Gln) amidotransferase subunit A
VSRYGLIAHGSSLDQIGPIATTVHDAALLLGVLAGVDPADSTSAPEPVADYASALTGDARGARIGVPRALLEGVDADVAASTTAALESLRARGATLVDVDLPHARYATPVYYLVSTAEASSNLARYDGVRYGFRAQANPESRIPNPDLQQMYRRTRAQGFGREVKRRIMLGTYVLSAGYYDAYYLKAQQVRTLILRDYDRAFERVDVVAMPTSPVPAFRLGERVADPLQMYLIDVFTVSANLTGLPAISVPCGFTRGPKLGEVSSSGGGPGAPKLGEVSSRGGLPIGLQLTGRRFDETTLLRVADAYERDNAWSTQLPPILNR